MSNPFLDVSSLYAQTSAIQNPYIAGGKVGGNGGEIGQAKGTGAAPKVNPAQAGVNEVANIGMAKKAGFEVGLGGTNNPDDHKLFYAA